MLDVRWIGLSAAGTDVAPLDVSQDAVERARFVYTGGWATTARGDLGAIDALRAQRPWGDRDMRIVIALANDALHRLGGKEGARADTLVVRSAAAQLARIAQGNDVVIVHSDGYRISSNAAPHHEEWERGAVSTERADAEAEGEAAPMKIGTSFQRELRNMLPSARRCAALHTQVEVDRADPAFDSPNKAVGPMLTGARALAAAREKRWHLAHDGIAHRHVVPSPQPVRLLQEEALRRLVEQGAVVVCTVGVMPVVTADDGALHGVDAVIDEHDGAALVARTLNADLFVIATDKPGVFLDWGTANSKLLRHGHPSVLHELACTAGTMSANLEAAARFAERTGRRAAIGALSDVARLVEGTAGTTISCERVDPRGFAGGAVAC